MLIIPLQRRLGLASFPWVTLALLLTNVFVYFVLQSSYAPARDRAYRVYVDERLGEIEMPAYLAWLKSRGEADTATRLETLDEPERTQWTLVTLQQDASFLAALRAGEIIGPQHPRHAQWQDARRRFDALWSESFTERNLLRYDRPTFATTFSSMFLHGSVDHLVGNMVFLVILGLLVEAALGPGLYLGVYLVGGLGAAALSLLRHHGDANGLLGASGAIAALMGAFCVLWGLRKVRVFWWFFIVFNYARITALWLLPVWLGWELFNLWSSPDANVAFDAHAGGIIAGALLAAGVRKLGWERRDFLDGEAREEDATNRFEEAMGYLGRLELPRARAAFAELAAVRPDDLAILVPLYRSWRSEPNRAEFHDVARRILLRLTTKTDEIVQIANTFRDYLAATGNKPRLKPDEILQMARRFTPAGRYEDAERLLTALATRAPGLDGLADALLDLAIALRGRSQPKEAQRVLTTLRDRCAGAPAADKAAFLLANG